MQKPLTPAQRAYLEWLCTADDIRLRLGLPRTDAEYAKTHSVGERTLRSWKRREDFTDRLAELRPDLVDTGDQPTGPAPSADGDRPPASTDPAKLADAIDQLLADRIDMGDVKAVETLLRVPTFKAYLDARTAQMTATFENLTDEELAADLLADFTTAELEAELERRAAEDEE